MRNVTFWMASFVLLAASAQRLVAQVQKSPGPGDQVNEATRDVRAQPTDSSDRQPSSDQDQRGSSAARSTPEASGSNADAREVPQASEATTNDAQKGNWRYKFENGNWWY